MNTPFLPPPDAALLTAYEHLTAELDQRMQGLILQRFPTLLHCGPGCAGCCIEFAVLPLEAAVLQDVVLRKKKPVMMIRSQKNRCVFLRENSRCSVYDRRPILCRTQGLALAYIDDETRSIEVSACPINFPEEFIFEQDNLLFMDSFNDRLAALNLQYCRQAGLQPDCRISLSTLAGTLK